jgi:hypothetical protein
MKMVLFLSQGGGLTNVPTVSLGFSILVEKTLHINSLKKCFYFYFLKNIYFREAIIQVVMAKRYKQ